MYILCMLEALQDINIKISAIILTKILKIGNNLSLNISNLRVMLGTRYRISTFISRGVFFDHLLGIFSRAGSSIVLSRYFCSVVLSVHRPAGRFAAGPAVPISGLTSAPRP